MARTGKHPEDQSGFVDDNLWQVAIDDEAKLTINKEQVVVSKDLVVLGSIFGLSLSELESFPAAETISDRDFVYMRDGKVYKASALFLDKSFVVGIAIGNVAQNDIAMIFSSQGKVLGGFNGLVSNSRYFLSKDYGKISNIVLDDKDFVVYQVGIAKSDTELLFYPRFCVVK